MALTSPQQRNTRLTAAAGLMPDHLIDQLCVNKSMITPYVDHAVTIDPATGDAVISYGLSSYGYDARLAPEYKVINPQPLGGILDPKAVDPLHYEDQVGPSLIIPAYGFALGRTVEYFKIPDDVMVICLAKSTFARCFTGDTRVALVDGTEPTFEELVARAETGERLWGYSINERGMVDVAELIAPRKVGHETVLEIELDNGKLVRCTPDHEFVMRDGNEVAACDLTVGDAIMPLYRGRGYEAVYQLANNHKVVAIRSVAGTHDVYCLTAPEYGNFALASEVFVKNCGLVVGITPLEPEWEGEVTLELSNTTPLPIRVYGNEGICQFLFFKGMAPPHVSYADRKGKYQRQRGIVLPKLMPVSAPDNPSSLATDQFATTDTTKAGLTYG